ncbi:unnamed protein product, partial [Rotaria sp. Silwood1]
HDHSSSRRSSRSPDRRSSSYRNDHNTDKYSSTTTTTSGFSASPSVSSCALYMSFYDIITSVVVNPSHNNFEETNSILCLI